MSDAIEKFESMVDGDIRPHDYENVFERQVFPYFERVAAGVSGNGTERLFEMTSVFQGDSFYLLYVLLLSHVGREPGRYQSTEIVGRDSLKQFLTRYASFLDGDGRHHLWVFGNPGREMLVYDRHNIIYGYGPLDDYENLLRSQGYPEGKVLIPSPHRHGFDPKHAVFEDQLMREFEWTRTELVDGEDDD